jgi:DNA-directed RNA polymerase subunit RPC12/RpoP
MNQSTKTMNEQFPKAPRLNLGKNTCSTCGKVFIVTENDLPLPGTKDTEPVNCPYCGEFIGEVFVNGFVAVKKIAE